MSFACPQLGPGLEGRQRRNAEPSTAPKRYRERYILISHHPWDTPRPNASIGGRYVHPHRFNAALRTLPRPQSPIPKFRRCSKERQKRR